MTKTTEVLYKTQVRDLNQSDVWHDLNGNYGFKELYEAEQDLDRRCILPANKPNYRIIKITSTYEEVDY